MAFAVVHMQKIKAGGVRGIQSHMNREHPPRTNPDIDESRTPENYDIVPCRNFPQRIKQMIQTDAPLTRTVRKDAVVLCNFVVTSDNQTMQAMSPEQQRAFFTDSVQWFAKRYGHVAAATVHMDETTPHLHISVVPIGAERLSAKTLFDRQELTALQTDFVKEVGGRYGLERGKEGSERTHLSEQRFKLQTARTSLLEVSKQVDAAERQFAAYKGVQGKIEAIEAIQPKRVVGNVVVKPNEFAVLQEQAKAYAANSPELEQLHQLQQQLHDRQREADEREQQLRDRDRELDEREQQLHKAEIRQADLNGILTQTEEQLQKTQARRVQLFAENKALQQQLEIAVSDVDRLQQQLEIAVSDVDRLQQQQRHFVTVERCYEATAQLCAKLIGRASPLYQPELTPDAHTMLVQAAAIHDEISGQPVGKTLVESPRQPFPDKTFCSPEQYRQECARQQAEAEEREAERSHRRSGFDMEL